MIEKELCFNINIDRILFDTLKNIANTYDHKEINEYDDYMLSETNNYLPEGMKKAICDYIMRTGKFADGEEYEGENCGYFFGKNK